MSYLENFTGGGSSGTVTSVALATGAGATDALYTISGSPITTSGTLVETLNTQTANTFFAGPTSGGATTPTWRTIVAADIPSGTVIWNAIGNAAGNLTLANGTNTTTFNQTSNIAWTWANTTVATAITTNASPTHVLSANYWTGAVSSTDSWTLGSSLAAGTNGASTLSISHSGSTGSALLALGQGVNLEFQGSSSGTLKLLYGATGGSLTFSDSTGASTIGNASGFTVSGSGGGSIGVAANITLTANTGAGQGIILNKPIIKYNNISTVSNGVPSEFATVDLTAQSASISSATLYAVPASGAGVYRISYYMKVTQAATTSSSVTLTLGWTDRDDSTVASVVVPTPANATDSTSIVSGTLVVDAALSTNLTYLTTYASTGATAMQYKLRLKVEAL
jgi:hypothetical protein